MMRNKYIYAQAEASVVVKADKQKGGTWTGAVENLKKQWALPLCWDNPDYPGNQALIEMGANPIRDAWDGDPRQIAGKEQQPEAEQLSLF